MADPQKPSDPSRPGVMGDWSEEQNLGQPGDPKARITEEDVKAAFKEEPKFKIDGEEAPKPN
jgi:hypothetical protein